MALATRFEASPPDNYTGYKKYKIGEFELSRDEYFVHIKWPKGEHLMTAETFLRACMRSIAWNFFYGYLAYDDVFGTTNFYGTVEIFAGKYNGFYKKAGIDYAERFETEKLKGILNDMLANWVSEGYDPFVAPLETENPWGRKHGDNPGASDPRRPLAKRMVGLPGDIPLRSDASGQPINRMFADVPQDEPEIHAEPGFEGEVSAYNLYAYLSRSEVTWNPSIVSSLGESCLCPTTEEYFLPIGHGNDRAEWFIQFSDEIIWDIHDREAGTPKSKVTMRAGDVACMPGDIRHRGYSPKRSMLLVYENFSPEIPALIEKGEYPPVPRKF